MAKEIKYPDWLHGNATSLMHLPKPYIEFFVRWYYYDHTDRRNIPDTIPVENIEEYIVKQMSAENRKTIRVSLLLGKKTMIMDPI